MAELDDFFAKKDKKKSKSKAKFVTADELVKNLEEGTKREVAANAVKPRKPEVATAAVAAAVASAGGVAEGGENESNTKIAEPVNEPPPPVEEEWKEFEQEQRKDYSGLKIGQLTINEKQQQQIQQSDDLDDDDDEYSDDYGNGDSNTNSSGHGPWKKLIPAEEVTQIPVETEKPSAKTYVPPAYRASGLGMGSGSSSGLRARRTAPDITNTEFFPTLSAARPEEQRKKKNEPAFEEVRHGGRYQRVQETTAAPVAATNRFQSLDDEADS
ncbi:protein CDV3 homolog [Drosophila albomicans]|uniref:Protein CDV3 homolog n=1 Tax=Drosophila albomicans TaxID=7291 RepID=A0A6P8WW82_DROAB|nr:protein CDV3 homolog [Drosophila albomicans]